MLTQDSYRTINLFNWNGGIVGRRRNPLGFTENALAAGENVDVADGALRTRPGSSIMSSDSLPMAEVTALQQVRFPTNESSYLVAQVNSPDIRRLLLDFDGDYSDKVGRHTPDLSPEVVEPWYFGWALDSGAAYSGTQGLKFAGRQAPPEGGPYPGVIYVQYEPHNDFNFGYDQTPHLSWKVFCYIRKTVSTDTDGAMFWLLKTAGLQWEYIPQHFPTPDGFALTLKDADDNALASLSGDVAIPDNEWWRLQIECIAGTYRLRAEAAATWTTGAIRDEQTPGSPVQPAPSSDLKVCQWHDYYYTEPHGLEFDVDRIILKIGDAASIAASDPPGRDADAGGIGLWASADHLPTENASFAKIYDLGANAGVCTFATLNDRAVITEGLSDPPLVWGGCMADDASDWMTPKAVLVTQDGQRYYDISPQVCDKDPDSVADVANIRMAGHIDICLDMPEVEAIHIEMETPNSGLPVEAQVFQQTAALNDASKIARHDLKAGIAQWYKDGSGTGHFEGVEIDIDAGPAVDKGGGKVGIPATGHGLTSGQRARIEGTTNYNGFFVLDAATSVNELVIPSAYAAETFNTGNEKVRHCLTLDAGNDCPDAVPGMSVAFIDAEQAIVSVASAGSDMNAVTLDADHATGDVVAVYGLVVTDSKLTLNSVASGTMIDSFTKALDDNPFIAAQGVSVRQVINAADLAGSGDYIEVTIDLSNAASTLTQANDGVVFMGASIVERDGTTGNGVTTPTGLAFAQGTLSGGNIIKGATVTSALTKFAIDEAKDYIITLDLMAYRSYYGFNYYSYDPDYGKTPSVFLKQKLQGSGYYFKTGGGKYGTGFPRSSTLQTMPSGFTDYTAHPVTVGVSKIRVHTNRSASTALQVATTTDDLHVPLYFADSFVGVTVNQTLEGTAGVYHAVSLDQRQTFQVFASDDWRLIVRKNSGTWQYKDGSDAWQSASQNSLLEGLRQALAISANQMTGPELSAVTPEQWALTGGVVPKITQYMDFAVSLQMDGAGHIPSVSSYTVAFNDTGSILIEGYSAANWTAAEGWTDGTLVSGIPLARSGIISYDGTNPMVLDYTVVDQVPGYWLRIKTNGTAPGTAITRIKYKAPCQPLSNIGDGQPDMALGAVLYTAATTQIRDWTVELSDNVLTELSKADVPMQPEDFLYVGYLTQFNEIEITPYAENNQAASTLSAQYWNGEAWTPLTITDGTIGSGGNTLAVKGRVSWTLPTDWKTNIPFDASFSRGYWVRLSISAALTSTSAISEVRVYGVPDSLKKYRYTACFGNRIALGNRPDAPDQIDISREFEEYGLAGHDSGSFRLGGQDQIVCALSAWNGLLIGKTETFHFLQEGSSSFQTVEAARHVPINTQCIVKAPISGFDYGERYGLFFLNRYGAFVATGLHVDSLWNTSRGKTISDVLNWWDTSSYPRLDLAYLHQACGEYWPARNWIVWSVPMLLSSGSGPQASNNRLIIYDLTLQAWLPPFTIAAASLCTAYHYDANAPGKLGDMGLYAGDYQGRVLRLFGPGITSDSGSAIPAWVETGWLDFGSPEFRKLLRMLSLYGKTADDIITVSSFTDGDTSAATVAEFHGLSNLGGETFALEQESHNLQGRFFKFRIAFNDASEVYGLQIGTSLIREWGAL